MAANDPTRPRRPLTEFAQKYGTFNNRSRPDIIDALQGYKSGLTPVSPERLDDSENRREWKRKIANYQDTVIGGFPIPWSRALRAYIPTAHADFASHWRKFELENQIHPLIDGPQWETLNGCLKNYPPPLISGGNSGFMVVSVPLLVGNRHFQY